MTCDLFKRFALCAALAAALPATVLAGGYNGGSGQFSAITPQNAQAILTYNDRYQDGNFRVNHTESASAEANVNGNGETGSGNAYSNTEIQSDTSVQSWKRSVQRTSGRASNGEASGSGFTASIVRVRTSDGKWYVFKGMANTSASAGASGTASSKSGIAYSASGRN